MLATITLLIGASFGNLYVTPVLIGAVAFVDVVSILGFVNHMVIHLEPSRRLGTSRPPRFFSRGFPTSDTMRELHREQHDDSEEVYRVERVVTDSVEKRYNGGQLSEVLVQASWREGDEWETKSGNTKHEWVDEYTVNALYSIASSDNVDAALAKLVGVYPETTATGERLYRETVRSLRALDYTAEVVDNSTAEEVTVGEPLAWLREQYQKGVED